MANSKRRFVVKPRTTRAMENGLNTTQGTIGFGGKTQKILTDESVAREIDTEYGIGGKREVYVYEDERLEWHDSHDKQTDGMNHDKGGHRYRFGPSQSYAQAWDAFEKRRKDKKDATR